MDCLKAYLRWPGREDPSLPLQVRLFRMMCLTMAGMCLLVVLPVNSLQNLPALINVAVALLGLLALLAYFESLRGRDWMRSLFVATVLLLDPIWFLNAGSDGSLTFYYLPLIIYPTAFFRGRTRWLLISVVLANVCAMIALEYFVPNLTVPFQRPSDRFLDLATGIVCSGLTIAFVTWVILVNYEREQARVQRIAGDLAASEKSYREVVETINEVFWVYDIASERCVYVSPAYERIWGRTRAEFLATPGAWLDSVHPEDRPRVAEAGARQASGNFDETYRILRPDGAIRWIRDRAYPVVHDGGAARIIGTAEDITERKELEARLLHSQRLEAIGTLASGVAHDLNNILTPMMMATSVLQGRMEDPVDRQLMSLLDGGARRGASIIGQLLTFSRGVVGFRSPVEPVRVMAEITNLLRETFPRNITIIESSSEGLWRIETDPTQLHQVLLNLCVNARDAMPDGGALTLAAENRVLAAEELSLDPAATEGRFVVFTVSDTGGGIAPEIRGRLFEPFFTTKPVGKGSGLGLSTVHGILRAHGGFVTVDSTVGKGSTFRAYFPALGEAAEDRVAEGAAAPSGNGEQILIVDDEDAILATTRHALGQNGYRVHAVAQPKDAIALLETHADEIRVVILDIMMPGMDGKTLAPILRRIAPRVRVLGISGLETPLQAGDSAGACFDAVLPKPFDLAALLSAVRRLADQPVSTGR